MRGTLFALLLALPLFGCGTTPSVDPASAPDGSYPSSAPAADTAEPDAPATTKVNLNTATREEFLQLPEVTDRMAHEFDEYRPYTSIRQFRREIGKYVDEAQVARYENHVFVPIAVNECDAETLQQIPGVNAAIAATIIKGRPYATPDAALAELKKHVDAGAIERARAYLAR